MAIFIVRKPVVPVGGSILFQMDMSSGAAEGAGWSTAVTESLLPHTRVRQATGSTTGGPGYLLTQSTGSGDNVWGWIDRSYLTALPIQAEDERVIRLKFFYPSGQNFGGTTMVNKMITPHDSTNGVQERAIMQIEANSTNTVFKCQHDGGDNIISHTISTVTDTRMSVQWYMRYSSAFNVADGGWKLWVNNNNFSDPDAVDDAMVQNTPTGGDYNQMSMGYMNTGLTGGNSHTWFIEAFEVGTEFDPTWAD